jgi:hypothetical protein
MNNHDHHLWVMAQWEQAIRERDQARWAATIARESPPCEDYDEGCPVCKANKLIDQWEESNE